MNNCKIVKDDRYPEGNFELYFDGQTYMFKIEAIGECYSSLSNLDGLFNRLNYLYEHGPQSSFNFITIGLNKIWNEIGQTNLRNILKKLSLLNNYYYMEDHDKKKYIQDVYRDENILLSIISTDFLSEEINIMNGKITKIIDNCMDDYLKYKDKSNNDMINNYQLYGKENESLIYMYMCKRVLMERKKIDYKILNEYNNNSLDMCSIHGLADRDEKISNIILTNEFNIFDAKYIENKDDRKQLTLEIFDEKNKLKGKITFNNVEIENYCENANFNLFNSKIMGFTDLYVISSFNRHRICVHSLTLMDLSTNEIITIKGG